MIETEADEYKLNSETHQQSLRISLINNEKIAMILINKLINQRYSSYLSLQNLKQLSQAFAKVNNIKDALTILKTTIESGNISLIEGYLPPKQHKLVVAWMEIHKEELLALWEVSQNDGEIFKIDPLK